MCAPLAFVISLSRRVARSMLRPLGPRHRYGCMAGLVASSFPIQRLQGHTNRAPDWAGVELALMVSGAFLVVRAMALDTAGVLRDPKHALHPADHAACHATHGSADSAAHRTGRPVADRSTLLSSPHNPLRLSRSGKGKNSQ